MLLVFKSPKIIRQAGHMCLLLAGTIIIKRKNVEYAQVSKLGWRGTFWHDRPGRSGYGCSERSHHAIIAADFPHWTTQNKPCSDPLLPNPLISLHQNALSGEDKTMEWMTERGRETLVGFQEWKLNSEIGIMKQHVFCKLRHTVSAQRQRDRRK